MKTHYYIPCGNLDRLIDAVEQLKPVVKKLREKEMEVLFENNITYSKIGEYGLMIEWNSNKDIWKLLDSVDRSELNRLYEKLGVKPEINTLIR